MNEFFLDLIKHLNGFTPKLLSALFISAVAIMIWILIRHSLERIRNRLTPAKAYIAEFILKLLRTIYWLVVLMSILGTWGIDISAVIAGLGLTGFAVGFALKDILASALAGILVLIYQPFQRGEKIKALGVEGRIVSIDMRYTTVVEGAERHLLPNAKLLAERVTVLEPTE